MSVKEGEVVDIKGPSGSCPSTLFNLFLGVSPLLTGKITIDDKLLTKNIQSSFHEIIGFVLPRSIFKEDTLKDNLDLAENTKPGKVNTMQRALVMKGLAESLKANLEKRVNEVEIHFWKTRDKAYRLPETSHKALRHYPWLSNTQRPFIGPM